MDREMRCIRKGDPEYPERLRPYERMPERLYVRGDLPDPSRKSVAVVGARACSAYGRAEALRFAGTLARNGVQIISGLALGIDSWAHIGALEAGGRTVAVLGSGADVCYPVSHGELYRRILETDGGILSEFEPGTPPLPHHFPLRNRIISALADAVLVIEARRRSGSLITVSYALEQGKPVYAVPGRNGDAVSEGCNRLIADGAGAALDPGTILEELGLEPCAEACRGRRKLPDGWAKDPGIARTYEQLTSEEKGLDRLLEETGCGLSELTTALMQLCIAGYAAEHPGRRYTLAV